MIDIKDIQRVDRNTLKKTYTKIIMELTRHSYGISSLETKDIIRLEEYKKAIRDEMARKDRIKKGIK